MNSDQILAEIREANLSYLMLAQSLIRADREQALYRLGLSEDSAAMIAALTPAQIAELGLGVTLYLVFFLFRDGESLTKHFTAAIPMPPEVRADLLSTFTTVVRATVQGDIMVALLQGALGGFGFWVLGVHAVLLWTVLMSILALLPVFGAALVWAPVAVYFMASGHVVEGLGLLIYGTLVISLVDNLVRPYLVGKATRIPDFVVLLSTIGGIASFGVQGFITGPVVAAMFIAVWRSAQPSNSAKAARSASCTISS